MKMITNAKRTGTIMGKSNVIRTYLNHLEDLIKYEENSEYKQEKALKLIRSIEELSIEIGVTANNIRL